VVMQRSATCIQESVDQIGAVGHRQSSAGTPPDAMRALLRRSMRSRARRRCSAG